MPNPNTSIILTAQSKETVRAIKARHSHITSTSAAINYALELVQATFFNGDLNEYPTQLANPAAEPRRRPAAVPKLRKTERPPER